KPFITNADKIINDWFEVMSLFTGLEIFGHNGGGDSCFFSALPSPLNATAVYYFNHENEESENRLAYSMAGLVAALWRDKPYDDDDKAHDGDTTIDASHVAKAMLNEYNAKAEKIFETRPFYHNPEMLFKRTHWLIGHPLGEPTFHFAQKMEQAPTYADWQEE